MTHAYNIEITEADGGHFHARCRETGTEIESANPEHDLCHALVKAEWGDRPVQFWTGGMRTLSHSSMFVMAGLRIELGETFPYRRAKRRPGRPCNLK